MASKIKTYITHIYILWLTTLTEKKEGGWFSWLLEKLRMRQVIITPDWPPGPAPHGTYLRWERGTKTQPGSLSAHHAASSVEAQPMWSLPHLMSLRWLAHSGEAHWVLERRGYLAPFSGAITNTFNGFWCCFSTACHLNPGQCNCFCYLMVHFQHNSGEYGDSFDTFEKMLKVARQDSVEKL